MSKKINALRVSAILYIVAIIFFFWGLVAGKNGLFPWKQIAPIYKELHTILTFKDGPPKSVGDKILLDRLERRMSYSAPGFFLYDQDFTDNGYLLLSRYSKPLGSSTVELFSIAEQKVIHEWPLPREEIEERAAGMNFAIGNPLGKSVFRALHPLLLDDGGLVFNAGLPSPLIRIDACGKLVWMIKRNFHHSNELDHNGNIVSPIVLKGKGPTVLPIRDDGYAVVSPEGEILEERSVSTMLLENGYRGLLYGVGNFMRDRIHLNDAQPVMFNTDDAEVGDVLLSSRHLSMVALYKPGSGKIKWLQVGPWLNQHDINQLEDGTYSIFGNDVVNWEGKRPKLIENTKSDVYIFDPRNGVVTHPYSDVMAANKISTPSSGRARVLENGDVYVEATDRGKLYRISKDRVRWEFVNSASAKTVGLFSWSRYINGDEIDLKWKDGLECD